MEPPRTFDQLLITIFYVLNFDQRLLDPHWILQSSFHVCAWNQLFSEMHLMKLFSNSQLKIVLMVWRSNVVIQKRNVLKLVVLAVI
jgi:hypothetical protein